MPPKRKAKEAEGVDADQIRKDAETNAQKEEQVKGYLICCLEIPLNYVDISKSNPSHPSRRSFAETTEFNARVASLAKAWSEPGAYKPVGEHSISCVLAPIHGNKKGRKATKAEEVISAEKQLQDLWKNRSPQTSYLSWSDLPQDLSAQFAVIRSGEVNEDVEAEAPSQPKLVILAEDGAHRISIARILLAKLTEWQKQVIYVNLYQEELLNDPSLLNLLTFEANQFKAQRQMSDAALTVGHLTHGGQILDPKHAAAIKALIRVSSMTPALIAVLSYPPQHKFFHLSSACKALKPYAQDLYARIMQAIALIDERIGAAQDEATTWRLEHQSYVPFDARAQAKDAPRFTKVIEHLQAIKKKPFKLVNYTSVGEMMENVGLPDSLLAFNPAAEEESIPASVTDLVGRFHPGSSQQQVPADFEQAENAILQALRMFCGLSLRYWDEDEGVIRSPKNLKLEEFRGMGQIFKRRTSLIGLKELFSGQTVFVVNALAQTIFLHFCIDSASRHNMKEKGIKYMLTLSFQEHDKMDLGEASVKAEKVITTALQYARLLVFAGLQYVANADTLEFNLVSPEDTVFPDIKATDAKGKKAAVVDDAAEEESTTKKKKRKTAATVIVRPSHQLPSKHLMANHVLRKLLITCPPRFVAALKAKAADNTYGPTDAVKLPPDLPAKALQLTTLKELVDMLRAPMTQTPSQPPGSAEEETQESSPPAKDFFDTLPEERQAEVTAIYEGEEFKPFLNSLKVLGSVAGRKEEVDAKMFKGLLAGLMGERSWTKKETADVLDQFTNQLLCWRLDSNMRDAAADQQLKKDRYGWPKDSCASEERAEVVANLLSNIEHHLQPPNYDSEDLGKSDDEESAEDKQTPPFDETPVLSQ